MAPRPDSSQLSTGEEWGGGSCLGAWARYSHPAQPQSSPHASAAPQRGARAALMAHRHRVGDATRRLCCPDGPPRAVPQRGAFAALMGGGDCGGVRVRVCALSDPRGAPAGSLDAPAPACSARGAALSRAPTVRPCVCVCARARARRGPLQGAARSRACAGLHAGVQPLSRAYA
jgi:hypothetical protein